jgi:hypothetical protein
VESAGAIYEQQAPRADPLPWLAKMLLLTIVMLKVILIWKLEINMLLRLEVNEFLAVGDDAREDSWLRPFGPKRLNLPRPPQTCSL